MKESTCPLGGHGLEVKICHTMDWEGALTNYVTVTGSGREKYHDIFTQEKSTKSNFGWK